MTPEFDARRQEPYPHADAIDREALRFLKSWHRAPELQDVIWYRGVNLGEVDEYDLLPHIIRALVAEEEREST